MKYSRAAAILLTSSAAASAFETRNHAHDDVDVVNTMRIPMMYGYYIGCVAFGQNNKDQLPAKVHNTNDKAVAVVYDVADQSPASMKIFNPPTTFDTSSAAEHHTNHTDHATKNFHFIHQMNLLMISRSMHNKEQPFIQGPLALGLFLLALLVGLAWRKDREDDQKTDGTEIKMHHDFDLISKRLYNNGFDFDEIGLTSTNDDDDDEEEEQEEKEDDNTSVVSVANTDYQQHLSSLIKKEVVITEKKEENKIVKPILKNVTNVKSIMVGSTSALKNISALPKAKKKVTFHDIHQDDEVTIASSVAKPTRKFFRLKHFRIHSCRKGEE